MSQKKASVRKTLSVSKATESVSEQTTEITRTAWIRGNSEGKMPIDGARGWLFGGLAFGALALGSLAWGIPHVEGKLTDRAQAAMTDAGIDSRGIDTDFSWRDGTISGTLPPGVTEDQIRNAVAGTEGVRTLKFDLDGAADPEPVTDRVQAQAEVSNGKLALNGSVLTQEHKAALNAAGIAHVGVENLTNNLTVLNATPQIDGADARVRSMARIIEALPDDSTGSVSLNADVLDVEMTVTDETGAASLAGVIANAGLEGSQNVGVADAPAAEPAEPTLDAEIDLMQAELDGLQAEIAENVVFASGSAVLTPVAQTTLDKVAAVIQKYEKPVVEAEGHTDDQGPADGNTNLSQARATAVADYLVSSGVDPNRIRGVGYGEDQPVADNATEEGRQTNRRVQFTARPSF